ncbi:MAG TPA: hypothetical protein VNQ31_09845 [Sphingomonadaceae bacterium]|nr:hypothetical protein [Sphingomonadaceae bacterium]
MDEETILPTGEYAIVEILGHRTLVGRCEEVERFGTKMLSIEPVFDGALLPAVLIGGGSLYAFTRCSAAVALQRCHKEAWQLPASIRATLPAPALPAPEGRTSPDDDEGDGISDDDDDDEIPF